MLKPHALVVMLLAVGATAQPLRELREAKPVGYRADRCRYEAPARRVSCVGHVVVSREDLRLRCDALDAELDVQGRITRLVCTGQVEIVTRERTARSQVARYDALHDQVVLDGEARVAQGQSRVAGQSITLDLQSGDIQVEGAVRGVLGPEVVQRRAP